MNPTNIKIRGVILETHEDLFETLKVLAPSAIPEECKVIMDWNEDDQMYIQNGHNDGRCKCGCQVFGEDERLRELQKSYLRSEWFADFRGIADEFKARNEQGLELYTWPCSTKWNNQRWVLGNGVPESHGLFVSVVEDAPNDILREDKERILSYFGYVKSVVLINTGLF